MAEETWNDAPLAWNEVPDLTMETKDGSSYKTEERGSSSWVEETAEGRCKGIFCYLGCKGIILFLDIIDCYSIIVEVNPELRGFIKVTKRSLSLHHLKFRTK